MNVIVWCAYMIAVLPAQLKPLPDPESFRADLAKIVDIRSSGNIVWDGSLQHDSALDQYTYRETKTSIILDSKGKTKGTVSEVLDVIRSAETGKVYRKPISKNGKPVIQEPPKPSRVVPPVPFTYQPVRRDPIAEERDIQALYEIHAAWSEPIDGHSVIALTLQPNARYKAKTDLGKWQQHFVIRAWLTETGHEVIRQESEAISDIPVARPVKKGTMMKLERRLIRGEVWIPVRTEFHIVGSFLEKGERGTFISEFSDFRKYVVDVELKP
jgi:hypothetical protein